MNTNKERFEQLRPGQEFVDLDDPGLRDGRKIYLIAWVKADGNELQLGATMGQRLGYVGANSVELNVELERLFDAMMREAGVKLQP